MLILFIDTCTERGVVAFANDCSLIFQQELPLGLQNSKYLIPTIHAGLNQLSLKLAEFSLIVAAVGHGSYTGIRVGAAAAKAISFSASLPIVGMSSLSGFVPFEDGKFASVIDAKQGGIYLLQGERIQDEIHYFSGPQVVTLEQAVHECSAAKWLVTPVKEGLEKKWKCALHQEWVERYPDPFLMMSLGRQKFDQGIISTASDLNLIYLKEWGEGTRQ
jgi:tRNA threonylcarbamoyl adenosine modification protein YeaZ